MSYILEALRKSERQRQTGQVPTLPDLVADPPPRRQPWLAALVVGLVLFNIGGLGYLWLKDRNKVPAATAGAQTPAISGAPAAAKEQTPKAATGDAAKIPPAPVATAPAASKPQPPRLAPRAEAAKSVAAKPSAAPTGDGVASKSAPGPIPASAERPPRPAIAQELPTPAPAPRSLPADRAASGPRGEGTDLPVRPGDTPLLRAMPSDFRERVPPFKINLYAYSNVPTERFAIIDMKKYRVGDRIPGGALLLEMRADSLVLELDGTKFRVPRI